MAIDPGPIKNPDFETDGNSPAFSVVDGLTKREYFAAMAMQGLLANDQNIPGGTLQIVNISVICKASVHMADSLINSLNQ